MEGLAPIRTESRDQAVLSALARFVAETGIVPGMRLPTERELSERLAVSRSTVREALKRWEGLGIVEMRQGSGSFLVRPVGPDSVHVPLILPDRQVESLLHMVEVRRGLESEAAAICAERATEAEIAAIGRHLDALERAFVERDGHSAPEDWAFHQAIIHIAGNPLFIQILMAMHDLLERFWQHPLGIADFGHASFPYHRKVYEAILRRDPMAARAASLALIDTTRDDLLRGAARAAGPAS